jgi:hypothetical protein
MNKFFVLAAVFFLISSCSTTTSFQVTKVGEEPEEYRERVLYVLPQTLLRVTVEIEKETFIPGPYRLFTEKFLGLDEYISEAGYSYRITDVNITDLTEPDPEQFYSINVIEGEPDWEKYMQLSMYGLVLDPASVFSNETNLQALDNLPETPYFTDRSVKRNLTEVTDTLYKTVIQDSSYVRIPILRKQREAKTLEQKAEEAANFIIKTRKRRFKLLAGQYEIFPEGEALAISVEELDKIEKEYLELFLGKRIKQKFTKSYLITPESTKDAQSEVFAKFSSREGLLDQANPRGNELKIEIIPAGKVSMISSNNNPVYNSQKLNNLYYRIPDVAEIKIQIENELLYEGRSSIYQLGEIMNYPVHSAK